jgi:2',3'-cyclic-nucleotide 2'-phosphodiesterase (5'-nucleotidase family)
LAAAENIRLTVYETNDIHGWIMARPASWNKEDPKRMAGGFAALANVLKQEQGPKLVLDAGDWFQGTPEGSVSRGKTLVPLLNAVGYDAVEIGNHEFDNGEKELKGLISQLKMPVLAANLYDAKTHQRVAWAKPWIIKDVAGVKVGIFGLLTTKMHQLAFADNIKGLYFRREADEAKDAVKALKEAGATVIIAVTHVGFEAPQYGKFEGDQTIASEVPGIDLIVGGHTHTRVTDPPHDPKNGTLITQAGTGLTQVGKAVLEIDPATKKVVSSKGELETLWIDKTGEDADVLALVHGDQAEVSKAFDVVIGTAAEALMRDPAGEGAMGDWMTDCERHFGRADISLLNGGGIRADLPAGPVTLRSIYNIMPFDNYAVQLVLTGKQVQQTLDYGAAMNKEMVQTSGVSFSYARHKPDGQRVSKILVGGKPLNPDAKYTLETIDFLIKGGDGYTALAQARRQEPSQTLLRDVLRGCVEKEGLVKAPPSGRMISLEDSNGTQERSR